MADELIYKKITEIMAKISAIGKDQNNAQQHFKYRGIDDVYNSLHPLLSEFGVFTVPEVLECESSERPSKNGGVLFYEKMKVKYTFFAEDGSSIAAIVKGIAMDSGDKAANKAMAIAHKYALLQVFCIPTKDTPDPDSGSPEPAASGPPPGPPAPAPGPATQGAPSGEGLHRNPRDKTSIPELDVKQLGNMLNYISNYRKCSVPEVLISFTRFKGYKGEDKYCDDFDRLVNTPSWFRDTWNKAIDEYGHIKKAKNIEEVADLPFNK